MKSKEFFKAAKLFIDAKYIEYNKDQNFIDNLIGNLSRQIVKTESQEQRDQMIAEIARLEKLKQERSTIFLDLQGRYNNLFYVEDLGKHILVDINTAEDIRNYWHNMPKSILPWK